MNQKSRESNSKVRKINPRSLENLKLGAIARNREKIRMNFTLLPETVEWLKQQPNASEAIDQLVKTVRENGLQEHCQPPPPPKFSQKTQKSNRGYILTEDGLSKLKTGIRERENSDKVKYTQEKLQKLTELDPKTFRKILNRKVVDLYTLKHCFTKFNFNLEDSDYISAAQAIKDPNFVGREKAILKLNDLVDNQKKKIIVIQARGGVGKTTLALKYLQHNFDKVLKLWIAKETQNITPVEAVVEEWLRRDFNEEPGRDFGVTLSRLRQKLCDSTCRIGVLIDNIETALDQTGKLIETHSRYKSLLQVLADPLVQSVTLITSRERLREADVTVYHYRLDGLELTAWQQFFQSRQIQIDPALQELHTAYEGNAKAMQILSSEIVEDFGKNLAAYWQKNQGLFETDLENLVVYQFNRLHLSQVPDAYNLLSRLGCYRYQDVAWLPIEGLLCLLWDVPVERRRRVVEALQDKSLVDFTPGKYWLHPVIRAEAIRRLRASQDWETANRQAAEFWTDCVLTVTTTEDALKAFEAYHHYIQIHAFKEAANVILRIRNDCLGRSFYQLGLFKQIISAITLLVNKLDSEYHLSGLYNLLGISCRSVGDIHQAIDYHEKAQAMAEKIVQLLKLKNIKESQYLDHHYTEALINIGLCKIQLWELEEALLILERVRQTAIDMWQPFILILFAFINSCLERKEKAIDNVNEIQKKKYSASDYVLIFLSQAYANLGEIEKSLEICLHVEVTSRQLHHSCNLGRAKNTLAILSRKKQSFTIAVEYHESAIDILSKLEAKYELAEAYYQLGLTYQEWSKKSESYTEFEKAIQLFDEIKAPKQVERVNKSLKMMKNKI